MIEAAYFLCDRTGRAAEPWAEAGYECWCIDMQHSIRRKPLQKHIGKGVINFAWGDVRSWTPPNGRKAIFVGAFPPCTHVAISGSRDFVFKRGMMLRDALETFEACRLAAAWSGAPYFIENPMSILSSLPHIGTPDYYFHPYMYAGWHPADNYTKNTCLWVGNNFIMPQHRLLSGAGRPDDRIHKASSSDFREETPKGFSLAVFDANKPGAKKLRGTVSPGRFF